MGTTYLLLYVDDIVLTASSPALLQSLIQQLKAEFSMTDMGDLHFFLGINVHRTASSLFLHQTQFTHDILERAGMVSCRPISTPVDTKAKLSASAAATAGRPIASEIAAGGGVCGGFGLQVTGEELVVPNQARRALPSERDF
ncbi:unnamed protein product [Cuscuta campestris]|uniref:Reverse transcriptase Ty1/copia-type domain-containing protein n=1 Tax=Cuscuta campestris TaxID=132261 RepID=A0A484LIB3_9ASTE|nr:unnamed protein product [Cuscuta campestris]